eukprot:1190972-Prorocentrum_minimum.AAC.2
MWQRTHSSRTDAELARQYAELPLEPESIYSRLMRTRGMAMKATEKARSQQQQLQPQHQIDDGQRRRLESGGGIQRETPGNFREAYCCESSRASKSPMAKQRSVCACTGHIIHPARLQLPFEHGETERSTLILPICDQHGRFFFLQERGSLVYRPGKPSTTRLCCNLRSAGGSPGASWAHFAISSLAQSHSGTTKGLGFRNPPRHQLVASHSGFPTLFISPYPLEISQGFSFYHGIIEEGLILIQNPTSSSFPTSSVFVLVICLGSRLQRLSRVGQHWHENTLTCVTQPRTARPPVCPSSAFSSAPSS